MDPKLTLTHAQRLSMTFHLRQAIEVLQMNRLELVEWLHTEVEKNPLLDWIYPSTALPANYDLAAKPTLYEHLQTQIREHFSDPFQRAEAEKYLELLDEKGWIDASVESNDILALLQTFDPPGIFARSLQEAWILQLKSHTLAARIVTECFDDLLHRRYETIRQKFSGQNLTAALDLIARLPTRPAACFTETFTPPILPDLEFCQIEGGWTISLARDAIPPIAIRQEYLELELENREEQETLRHFTTQAKWLFRSLSRRKQMLLKLGRLLVCKQARYLSRQGPLAPLTAKELAEHLAVHESTLSRALAGKYAATPRGLIALRSLISSHPETNTAIALLQKLIEQETKPLTDTQLAERLRQQGIKIARRTIAKYRNQLKIGSTTNRKLFKQPTTYDRDDGT